MLFSKLLVLACLGMLACGSEERTAPDVAKYRQLSDALAADVATHCAQVAAMTNPAGCPVERDRYVGEARAIVDELMAMSPSMDECMSSMGRTSQADMGKTCRLMSAELDAHMSAACSLVDLAQDQAEAERHCSAMQSLANRERDRADSMTTMMGFGMMSGGACHQ